MTKRGWVTIGDRSLYAEHTLAEPGFPTLVLLNGLSSSTRDWDEFLGPFLSEGYGSLSFDFRGQGRSLMREIEERGHFEAQVACEEQTADLEALLRHFQIPAPYHFVGMSYGGGIAIDFAARNPDQVAKLILIVPYLIRLDHAHPLQRTWSGHLDAIREMGALGSHVADSARSWYQQFITSYMDKRFASQVPDPTIRKASIDLTLGIMSFNALTCLAKLPPSSVHLITVGRDALVPRGLYSEMWSKLPERAKQSWLYIEDGEHLLLEQFPHFVAQWIDLVLADDPRIKDAKKFHAQGYSFEVWEEGGARFAFPSRPNWPRKQSHEIG
jgi:pimeloyl-ACP methyl ester carboxylesterase